MVLRQQTREHFKKDPVFRSLLPRARRLMNALIIFHDPSTGHLGHRTKNATLCEACECSNSTLCRARRELIEAGFIVGYAPGDGARKTGDGGWAGLYTIARNSEEAAAARALRQNPDAPYWPARPARKRLEQPVIEEQIRKPARRPRKTAQQTTGKARDVAHAADKPVEPASGWGPEDSARIHRGAAAAREAMGLSPKDETPQAS